METQVIRDEVRPYLKACDAFAEFSRYITTEHHDELTPAERKAIETHTQMLALNLPPIAPQITRPWRLRSPIPPID